MTRPRALDLALAAVALVLIALALARIAAAGAGVAETAITVEGTPVTVFRTPGGPPRPVVVVAHGFAGSQQLMRSFALTLARNGYVAVAFDFPGHGRNPHPLTGDVGDTRGATQTLVDDLAAVAAATRGLGDGRLAVLGHSMAADIVVRYAESHPEVAATVAVSMFSPAVTATAPRNLLVVVGDWESMLKGEALRAVGLASAPAPPEPGVTYGVAADGTARRAAFSAHVEHASVLFSRDSLRETLDWLDGAFGIARTAPPALDDRGPWILLLVAGVVLLARPLSALLPRLASPPAGAGLGWPRLWRPLLLPAVAVPLLLRVAPTHFLPVLVGDYLAAHFALYGVATALCLAWTRTPVPGLRPRGPLMHRTKQKIRLLFGATRCIGSERVGRLVQTDGSSVWVGPLAFAAAAAAVVAYGFVALVWPIDSFVTSFVPGPARAALVAAMLVGTLAFFLADEWMTRGAGAARGAYPASKLAFLVSLALAVGLDFRRLFFLVIIVPVIGLFFVVYGLFSGWVYRHTGNPLVAGVANAVAFAWAIGVTFPLLAG